MLEKTQFVEVTKLQFIQERNHLKVNRASTKPQVGNRCQLQNGRFYRGPHPPRYAPYVSAPTSKPVRPRV